MTVKELLTFLREQPEDRVVTVVVAADEPPEDIINVSTYFDEGQSAEWVVTLELEVT